MTAPVPAGAVAIVDECGPAVVVVQANGVITAWNAAAEDLYGFSASEALGRRVTDLVHVGDAAELLGIFAAAAEDHRVYTVPVLRRHKDGTPLPLTLNVHRVAIVDLPEAIRSAAPARVDVVAPSIDHVAELLGRMSGIVFDMDATGHVTYCAGGGLATLGVTSELLVGLPLIDLVEDDSAKRVIRELLGGQSYSGLVALGGSMWLISCEVVVGPAGEVVGVAGVLTPANEAWSRANTIALSEARNRALVQHATDLVCVVDSDANVSYVSPSVHKLLGWHPAEIIGRPVADFVQGDDLEVVSEWLQVHEIGPEARTGRTDNSAQSLDVRLRHANGGWRHYEVVTSDYLDDPAVAGFVVNGRDVTERRQADLRLRHANLHDSLTDLPNRVLLIDLVDSSLAESARPGGDPVAIVVVGLDRFKLVNDSLGHEIGDHLLVAVGRRLRRHARASDTVARMGGDTFVVTTNKVSGAEEARAMAVRLLAVVAEPFDLNGRRIAVTAGAGVALSEPDVDGATLVRNGDSAMYAAKRLGRNRVELYEASLRSNAARQLSLEQSLSRATAAGELRVHFQPIMNLETRAVVGVEALVRWQHPDLGLVPPMDFIPLSEETGHIVEIGSWVLEESCRTMMTWAAGDTPLRLSVNLSPRQMLEPDLPDVVTDVLRRTGYPVERLTMEVTESVLVDEGPYATTTLQRLRDMGVKLSIDDFGTGYSSLVYLRRLRANALKIDRSFVDGLGRDSEADAIVRTVIGLAQSLGLDLVAEGVETEEQRRILVELGCQFAQGYLFSRPLPADTFVEWRTTGGGLALVV